MLLTPTQREGRGKKKKGKKPCWPYANCTLGIIPIPGYPQSVPRHCLRKLTWPRRNPSSEAHLWFNSMDNSSVLWWGVHLWVQTGGRPWFGSLSALLRKASTVGKKGLAGALTQSCYERHHQADGTGANSTTITNQSIFSQLRDHHSYD